MESYLSVDDNCGGVDISSSNCMEDGVCCTVKGVLLTDNVNEWGVCVSDNANDKVCDVE